MSQIPAWVYIALGIANIFTAMGASHLARRGASDGEISLGAFFLGPALILGFLTSDRRPVCPHCKNRNDAGVRFCNTCSMQFRALLPTHRK